MPERVLILTRDFPPQPGGIAQVAYQLAFALAHLGHDVEVHCSVRVSAAECADLPFSVRSLSRGEYRSAFADYVDAGHPSRVIAVHWKACRDTVSACRRLMIPLFVVVHGKEVTERRWGLARLRLSRVLTRCDRVVCVSRFTERVVRERFRIADSRTAVIHPGADTERYSPGPPAGDVRARFDLGEGPVLLTVGRVVERKGHDMVVRALPEIIRANPSARYVICGEASESIGTRLRALGESLGVSEHVAFVGHVPEDVVADLYRACDVCIMTSRILPGGDSEGFGITYLEAGACAKPVVGGRQAGVLDAIEDGTTGFLVDPEDPAEIAEAVTRLFDDPRLAQRMGKAGYARVQSDFTWTSIAGAYLALPIPRRN